MLIILNYYSLFTDIELSGQNVETKAISPKFNLDTYQNIRWISLLIYVKQTSLYSYHTNQGKSEYTEHYIWLVWGNSLIVKNCSDIAYSLYTV